MAHGIAGQVVGRDMAAVAWWRTRVVLGRWAAGGGTLLMNKKEFLAQKIKRNRSAVSDGLSDTRRVYRIVACVMFSRA